MNPFLSFCATVALAWTLGFGAALAQDPPPTPEPPSEPVTPKPDVEVSPPDGKSLKFEVKFDDSDSDGIVQNGVPVTVKTNEVVPNVIVISSSATIDGVVEDEVVVIGGEVIINGRVEGDVVNVGGGIVLGPKAHIGGKAVGVLGGIEMGANSVIEGDAVGVLGGVRKADGARVGGKTVNMAMGDLVGPDGLGLPEWLKLTFTEIVMKLRILSFQVGWVWVVAGLFLLLHALFLLAAPGIVRSVVTTFSERGATSFLMGLVSLPLAAFLSLILLPTVVGVLVIPFIWAALLFAGLVGKGGLLQFFGSALGRGVRLDLPPLVSLLVGAVLVSLLYLIPFLGLLFWMTFAVWALGAAILALFGRFKKESPTPAPVTPRWNPPSASGPGSGATAATPSPIIPTPANPSPNPNASALGFAAATPGAASVSLQSVLPEPNLSEPLPPTAPLLLPPTPASSAAPVVPDALSLPRVGLKERLLASGLDWLLLIIVINWFRLDRLVPLVLLGYFVGMWVWRQTTVGGIILRLRVARLDGRPIDVVTALVRALGALFGGIALGLGYFWSAWDPDKQGWHDKVAGTVVVRLPKTQPLV
ncbi:MAG: RDD family protein [Verrucomicrobia bacterium]|nr:RDD family protein [Verrucomicrobiota bacterium]